MTLVQCPTCTGEGGIDFTVADALAEEHLDDETLRALRDGGCHPLGFVPCDDCGATGLVTEGEAGDLRAAHRAWLDQGLAALRDRIRYG